MSVMRVAGGAPAEPLGRGHRKTIAIGVGVALFAHAAILYAVLQARGAPAVFEPVMDKPVVMDFPPIYRAPPPPPPKAIAPSKAQKPDTAPPTTQPPVRTRAADPFAGAASELTAAPQGTLAPATGTDPVGPPTPPAQTPPKADPVIRSADWARRPTGADMARFYPDRAQRLGVEGQTVIACTVSLAGVAENCRVVRETPANMGFGDAALKLTRSFRFKPMMLDGQPKTDGPIQVPLAWRLQ